MVLGFFFFLNVQLALEQHRFELRRSTYKPIFFSKYIGKILEISDNLKKCSLACFMVGIWYIIHVT